MRVADWIADYLYLTGVRRVHGLMGGGAAGLNDGFIKNGKIEYICYHHEQGAGHAAIGEAKYTGELAVVNPTTGCGGTNCMTSVLNAWQDGVPVLFLSGNVKRDNCTAWLRDNKHVYLRHYGAQEHDIVETVRSMTKYARFVSHAEEVPEILQRAIGDAQFGRKGPVWVDIPSDIQTAQMPEHSQRYHGA
jgi:acetolactate synthase I/II/III large subunit